MDAARTLLEGGGPAAMGLTIALVFGLFLLRASVVTPFATVVALEGGLAAPSLLILRVLSSLALALLIGWAVGRWRGRGRAAPASPDRVARTLARAQGAVSGGNALANFVLLGYVLNSYVAFGLGALLPRDRRRAAIGATIGELLAFGLGLAAILGLGAVTALSPVMLTAITTGLALALAAIPAGVRQARKAWA